MALCLTRHSQEINIQNMNIELVAQMFKNYQSNVLFHLEGMPSPWPVDGEGLLID